MLHFIPTEIRDIIYVILNANIDYDHFLQFKSHTKTKLITFVLFQCWSNKILTALKSLCEQPLHPRRCLWKSYTLTLSITLGHKYRI